MASSPSPNGYSGRGPSGRFAPGNRGGPGNPLGAQREKFRARVFAVMDDETFDRIMRVLIDKALAGEPWAIREVLDRLLGKASQPIEVEGERRLNIQAIWTGHVHDLIELARTAGKFDELPPTLRALALEAESDVIDTTAPKRIRGTPHPRTSGLP